MARNDWASNLALLLLGGAFAIASLQLNFGIVHRPGPGFLPFWTASGLNGITLCPSGRLTYKRD